MVVTIKIIAQKWRPNCVIHIHEQRAARIGYERQIEVLSFVRWIIGIRDAPINLPRSGGKP
jgi:hypothetical protein